MLENLIRLTGTLLIVSVIGYLLSIFKEKADLFNDRVRIPSRNVTQQIIDKIELKAFKLGKISLMIGDEIKVYMKDNAQIRGIVLGARKEDNCLCLVTSDDEVIELRVSTIRKLKVMMRYGRFF